MWKQFIMGLVTVFSMPMLSFGEEIKPQKAFWISTERCQSSTNTWLMYRKTISLNHVPDTLNACIAADTKYWLWINGKMAVREGGLKRGPMPNATYYDVVNIAPFLQAGENTIAIQVWHFGKDGFSHANSGKAGLLFEAHADGVDIESDQSWQCELDLAYQNTEAPHPNFRLAESNIRYDARNERTGWNLPDWKTSLMQAEIVAPSEGYPFGKLVRRPIPQWKDYGLKSYTEIRKSGGGDTLYCVMPYNCQMTPYIKIEAKAGKTIKMHTSHYDYLGKTVESVRAEYITRDGVQEYENKGWMNGEAMIYVIPEGVKVIDVKYRESGYDTEFQGSFHCNDSFFNELWKRSIRTLYVTMRDTYMDCPDRERAQWWGDEAIELGESFYAFSPSSRKLAEKGVRELIGWQKEDGCLFSPIPAGNWNKELPLQMLASVGWYGFYTQYFFSGDSTFVSDIYSGLHRYLHDVMRLDRQGLVIPRNGGWSWGDWGTDVDMEVLFNCWYYLALKAERKFAIQLEKTSDIEEIDHIMRVMRENFDARFWTGNSYRSPSYKDAIDDRAQAMAVLSGLASEDKWPVLLDCFKTEFHASPYMEKYVLEALFRMGQTDYALQRMKKRYETMIRSTHTTLFEGWADGKDGFVGTTNHAWTGGPLTLLGQYVCGISPSAPGFSSFSVRPQLGSLQELDATVPTQYGLIKISVKRKGNKMSVRLTVPQGTVAEVPVGKKIKCLSAGTYSFLL